MFVFVTLPMFWTEGKNLQKCWRFFLFPDSSKDRKEVDYFANTLCKCYTSYCHYIGWFILYHFQTKFLNSNFPLILSGNDNNCTVKSSIKMYFFIKKIYFSLQKIWKKHKKQTKKEIKLTWFSHCWHSA